MAVADGDRKMKDRNETATIRLSRIAAKTGERLLLPRFRGIAKEQ